MLIHRWMGVFFCVLFVMWFMSGIVLMYCGFPSVEADERLSRAAPLDPTLIRVTPKQALEKTQASGVPSQIRLNVLDGRPIYRLAFGARRILVFADDGARLTAIPEDMALRIASVWTSLSAATVSFREFIANEDQWTVYSSIRPFGPFWKFAWPNGEEVYVSRSTGEVVQDTTRRSRLGAYFGAIPHWLYFTWLARNGPLWSQVVICLAAAGTVTSLLGLIAGVWLTQARWKVPFAGLKHWHVFFGLIFGVFTCTWVFSGLLSMGPFSWLTDGDLPNLMDRIDVSKFVRDPRDAIGPGVKELELISFDGAAFYLARKASRESRIVPMNGDSQYAFTTGNIADAVRRAVSPIAIVETRLVTSYEPYYVDRQNQKPLPVVYVRLNDAEGSGYYIDPRSGRVVESYGTRSRWNRWLYHGLHSMDFPWLYAHRPAWDMVVLMLMLGGTALAGTSLAIAWAFMRRKFGTRGRLA